MTPPCRCLSWWSQRGGLRAPTCAGIPDGTRCAPIRASKSSWHKIPQRPAPRQLTGNHPVAVSPDNGRGASAIPKRDAWLLSLSLQRRAKFRGETGNGLRVRGYPELGPQNQNKKENHIMKNRKNILTYIVAAVVTLVVSASSSWSTQPLQGPENYTGKLTHGEFVSCEGQILNPPAYAVDGTWVLHIERMTEPQVPPPANLTMIVFRDGHLYWCSRTSS